MTGSSENQPEGAIARLLASVARSSTSRRRAVIAGFVTISAAFGIAALIGLSPSAGTGSLIPKAANASRSTDAIRSKFGDDPIVVMAKGNLRSLLLTTDIGRLLRLEGCLGGNVPKGATPYGGPGSPCAKIAASKSVERVYGPATFLNEAANQIMSAVGSELRSAAERVQTVALAARKRALDQGLGVDAANRAAAAAGAAEQQRSAAALARLQVETGLQGLPSIANQDFVTQVAFDASKGLGQPKTQFAYLFPSPNAALIQVRPRTGLTAQQNQHLIDLVKAATQMSDFKLKDGSYVVTGAPVLAESLATEVAAGALPLLVFAAIAMAIVLGLGFRVRMRLVPLVVALGVTAIVFGAMAILGLPLTVAAVGGVPVLIGLAVDYAVQLQSRSAELEAAGGSDAGVRAAAGGGPAIIAAASATAAGFLALLLSPVPMVRGFGLVLIAGVAVAVVVAISAGVAMFSARGSSDGPLADAARTVDASVRGAVQILTSNSLARRGGAALRSAVRVMAARPGPVLMISIALAVGGWAVEGSINVQSDITRLVPSGTPALRDLEDLEAQTGIAGEVDLMVSGPAATSPKVLSWIRSYRTSALAKWGYKDTVGCRGASLCPGIAITDLIAATSSAGQIQSTLKSLPEFFRRAVVTDDGKAVLTRFGIPLLPLAKQKAVFDSLRSQAAGAPAGVTAVIGGLPVIAAEANSSLADAGSRRLITLAALGLVALALLLALRSFKRIAVPLAATALATGWASLALWLLGIDLNPISAALGALVIAIATEFAVLISERHRSFVKAGEDPESAIASTASTTGRAVAISGMTVIAGFAVLGLSDIRALSEFGLATVVDLLVALAAVGAVVPAGLRLIARRTGGKA